MASTAVLGYRLAEATVEGIGEDLRTGVPYCFGQGLGCGDGDWTVGRTRPEDASITRIDEGKVEETMAALAKYYCTVKGRNVCRLARDVLGGNGILLDNHIGRFVADAEAIYSYEGTREMNTLIVGKAITGLSAFV